AAVVREGMPYLLIGGVRFYERREIKDVLAYLRVIANPDDSLSLLRIINVPPRKIGATTLAAVRSWASRHGLSLREAVRHAADVPDLASQAVRALQSVAATLHDLEHTAAEQPAYDLLT